MSEVEAAQAAELADEITHLRAALASQPTIEQAKGIVMARVGCDADRAFQLLVSQSQHENRKLRRVAAELVAHATARSAAAGDGAHRFASS